MLERRCRGSAVLCYFLNVQATKDKQQTRKSKNKILIKSSMAAMVWKGLLCPSPQAAQYAFLAAASMAAQRYSTGWVLRGVVELGRSAVFGQAIRLEAIATRLEHRY